ncbi:MAG TPA: flagellar motor protein [Vicinamibacterales bacterium]
MAVTRRARTRFQWTAVLGLPLGLALVGAGQALEGGTLSSILQPAAALIVFGGTAGAVLLGSSWAEIRQAARSLRALVLERPVNADALVQEIVRLAGQARRNGLMSLENVVDDHADPFLRKYLMHAVDGARPQVLRDMMELEIQHQEEHDEAPARVFEAAGGYLPTLGILGAVLGLIQTMQHLSEPEHIGGGIAVAFVATVYGVGAANLFCLPIAARLRGRAREAARHRELMMEGILAIQDGLNPRLVDEKLRAMLAHTPAEPGQPRRRVA